MKNILLLVSLFFCFSCKNQKEASANSRKGGDDFLLTIEHPGCRGFCPMYTITVDAKGKTTYTGKRNVDMVGIYTKTLSSDKVEMLKSELKENKFTEFEATYGPVGVDIPGCVTVCKMNGESHRVHNVKDAPKELDVLQRKLEEIIGTDDFVKSDIKK